MKINISSMKGSIQNYKHLLDKKVDFDKHYHIIKQGVIENPYGGKGTPYISDCLQDVEVNSIGGLLDIFSEFEEEMGSGTGHITIDVNIGYVRILDSWIE